MIKMLQGDIKQCPRCGWIANAYYEKDFGWCVQCENCGRMTDKYYTNRADAVKEWNGRIYETVDFGFSF